MLLLTDWDAKNCYDDLYFDTAAVEERRNWTAVFSYDHLPYNLLWNSGTKVRHISYDLLPRKSSMS